MRDWKVKKMKDGHYYVVRNPWPARKALLGWLIGLGAFIFMAVSASGCHTLPKVEGDMTRNDCIIEQTGWALLDQLPRILK